MNESLSESLKCAIHITLEKVLAVDEGGVDEGGVTPGRQSNVMIGQKPGKGVLSFSSAATSKRIETGWYFYCHYEVHQQRDATMPSFHKANSDSSTRSPAYWSTLEVKCGFELFFLFSSFDTGLIIQFQYCSFVQHEKVFYFGKESWMYKYEQKLF